MHVCVCVCVHAYNYITCVLCVHAHIQRVCVVRVSGKSTLCTHIHTLVHRKNKTSKRLMDHISPKTH